MAPVRGVSPPRLAPLALALLLLLVPDAGMHKSLRVAEAARHDALAIRSFVAHVQLREVSFLLRG